MSTTPPPVEGPRAGDPDSLRDTLVFAYGMQCPSRCDYCCHAVEEYGTAHLDPAAVGEVIRGAVEIGGFTLVAFTGGEPFLYKQDLLGVLEAVGPLELEIRLVTSAFWATSPQVAFQELAPWKERGLTQLSVSTDPTHQQFVPAERAENAIAAALEHGLVCELAAVFTEPGISLDDVVRVPEGVGRVVRFAAPTGRARSMDIRPEAYDLGPDRFRPCGDLSTFDITVFPDGAVYPCCSGGFNRDAGLSFGNIYQDDFRQIVGQIRADPFLQLVRRAGLAPLYELAETRFPQLRDELPELDPLVGTCQICVAVHHDKERLQRLVPLIEYANRIVDALAVIRREAESGVVVGVP